MDRVLLTGREAAAIRRNLSALYRQQSDIRIREPVRKCLCALARAERASPKRLSRSERRRNTEDIH